MANASPNEAARKRELYNERLAARKIRTTGRGGNTPLNSPAPAGRAAESKTENTKFKPSLTEMSNDGKIGPRQVQRMLKRARALARKKKKAAAKKAKEEITTQAGGMLSASLLKYAWLGLVESYGLTLAYINFHFLMAHMLKNKYFCKFGSEWTKGGGNLGDQGSKWFGPLEIIALFLLDIIIAIIILFVAFFIIQLVRVFQAFSSPIEFFKNIGGVLETFISLF